MAAGSKWRAARFSAAGFTISMAETGYRLACERDLSKIIVPPPAEASGPVGIGPGEV